MVQKGFWQDEFIGATRRKLEELYYNNPEAFTSEKRCILEYYETFEHLSDVLGDKLAPFKAWFYKATSPETISRCRRSLREEGIIKLASEEAEQKQNKMEQWQDYFRNNHGKQIYKR